MRIIDPCSHGKRLDSYGEIRSLLTATASLYESMAGNGGEACSVYGATAEFGFATVVSCVSMQALARNYPSSARAE